jgi:hypothetical protein
MSILTGVSKRRPDYFILVVVLLLIFLLAARTPLDTDLYWHLAAGRQTWQSGQAMVADTFSFTRAGQPWLNHSWLSQVMLYGLFQVGGSLALGVWMAGLATLSMGLMIAQMRGPAIFRAFLSVLAVTVAAVVWSPRPQLVSLALFALIGWLLYLYKVQRAKILWLLPFLFWAWSNLHGGWSLGLMWIGIVIAGEACNHLLGNRSAEVLSWREIGRLVMWTGLSLPALALHPNGLAILTIPFQTVEVQALQQFIQEWASPNFHEFFQQPYLWLMALSVIAFGLSGRKVDLTDLLLVLWFAGLGLVARRNFGPFALAATPVVSRYLWAMFGSLRKPGETPAGEWGPGVSEPLAGRFRPRWQKAVNLALVAVIGFAALAKVWAVTSPVLVAAASLQMDPVGATTYLLQNQARGRIFNEYNWGGYLIWTDPLLKVFVDGRTDLYGDEILGEWIQIIQAAPGWENLLDQWQVDWVMIDPTRPLAKGLAGLGWREVYRDGQAVIFQPAAGR